MEIDKLTDAEVTDFFKKAFEAGSAAVSPEAMNMMVRSASGLPILMHEIGDAVYLYDDDGVIGKNDAEIGIIEAAERIGKKYLDPKVYRAIRSKGYKSILRKLGNEISDFDAVSFRKSEMEEKLDQEEKKVFHNFLRKMTELGIIVRDSEGGPGDYKYVNNIYPIYIYLESQRH